MPPVTVEPATRDDVETLVDAWVALASDQHAHGSHLLAEENRATVREHVTHHVVGDRILVAREKPAGGGGTDVDDVVGFVQFSTEVGTYRMDVDRGVVETLYVEPEHRDQGVGSRLLERAERALAADGITTVSLEVMAENEAARRFYEDNGYHLHRVGLEKALENDTH